MEDNDTIELEETNSSAIPIAAPKTAKTEDFGSMEDPAVYELGFHLNSTISLSELSAAMSAIGKPIEECGGVFIVKEAPRGVRLSYTIVKSEGGKKQKFDTSHFGWMKFEVERKHVPELKRSFAENKQIIRFLLTETVHESTLAPKKVLFEKTEKEPPQVIKKPRLVKKEEAVAVISDEELERTIKELVAE